MKFVPRLEAFANRMERLSIMVATPPGFNPGMAATELALREFLRRNRLDGAADCYRLISLSDRLSALPADERRSIGDRAETGLEWKSALADEAAFLGAGAILYWADYLHMGVYLRELVPIVERAGAPPGTDVARQLNRLLLLEGADDATLARTISFGTTLLFNTLREERRDEYAAPLTRFLRGAKRVWVRDALSAARVAHLRNDYEIGYFGVDCALLLTREDVARAAAERGLPVPAHAGGVLTFFGREPELGDRLAGVARELAEPMRLPVRTLPWGDRVAFPRRDDAAVEPGVVDATTVYELLHEVAHAALVVTDTYHLALAAWNMGVPAVAAFAGHAPHPDDVSSGAAFSWRDKRETFFSQYDALDFLIRPEELRDPALLRRRTAHVREALADAALCGAVTARMRAHADAMESALARELASLIGAAVPA